MNKFKVGDIVNIYADTKVYKSYKITTIEDNVVIFATNRKGHKIAAHYKSCRRVKVKPSFYLLVKKDDDTVVLKTFNKKEIEEHLKEWDEESNELYSILKVKETNDFDV